MSFPNYNETHEEESRTTNVYNPETGEYEDVTYTALNPLYAGLNFKSRWGYCESCKEVFLLSEMQKIGGKYFCYKYKDAQDEILRREGK